MYYWLQEYDGADVYVISDDSEKVYIVEDGIAYLRDIAKHQLLRFKPYLEQIKETETFDFKIVK